MPSIIDVAKKAGVSFKTVSRVINGETSVRPQTRKKVLKAIAEIDYQPNVNARFIRSKSTGLLVTIVLGLTTTSYPAALVDAIDQYALKERLLPININIDHFADDLSQRIKSIANSLRPQAIIIASHYYSEIVLEKFNITAKIVLANCFEKNGYYPAVYGDEYTAACIAVRKIIEKNHKNIAFINISPHVPAFQMREHGFKDMLKRYGLDNRSCPILSAYKIDTEHKEQWQELPFEVSMVDAQVRHILEKYPDVSAIICGNDRIALEVYMALYIRGYKIPQDFAIISFDKREMITQSLNPTLATMAIPHTEIGHKAAILALNGQKETKAYLISMPYHSGLSL